MDVLVTGAAGMLGREVATAFARAGHTVTGTSRSRSEPGWRQLDVTDREACLAVLTTVKPDVVVHLAYDQHRWTVTADGAAHVAVAAEQVGAHVVFMSSDLVFAHSNEPRSETESPCPTTVYGAAKAAAEVATRAVLPVATIARTSLLIGRGQGHQEKAVHEAASGRWTGAFYTDQWRCPTYAPDVAQALVVCARDRVPGVVHLVGDDHCSRADLAIGLTRLLGVEETRLRFASAPTHAGAPPANLHLARTGRTEERVGVRLRGPSELTRLDG